MFVSAETLTLKLSGHRYPDQHLAIGRYGDGSTAIQAVSGGEVTATITVALAEQPHDGMLWIKNYSENEGVAEQLVQKGLLEPTNHSAVSGWVVINEYKPIGWLAAAIADAKAEAGL